jgi:outer membrane protein OmpU
MRKVLFATTALVALGGVSAASADISVSASSSFNYVTTNGGAEAAEDRDVNTQVDVGISAARTLDNGMSVTAMIGLDEASSGQSADGDDAGMTISGDFGTVAMGGSASDTLGAMSTDVTADEGWDLAAAYIDPANEHVPHMDVSVALPPISGLNVIIGMVDGATANADGTGFGASYSTTGDMPVTISYASYSTGAANSEVSSIGASVTAGAATIKVAANETGDYTGTSVGATYTVNEKLTVAAYTGTGEDSTNSAYEAEMTGMGLTYIIVDGLKLSITHNDFTGKGDGTAGTQSGSRTAVAIDVSF